MLPAPAVQAYWYIPRLNRGEWVLFMVDTGASATCLNGIHALDLQHKMHSNTISSSYGIGGSGDYYNEDAMLVFLDDQNQLLPQTIQIGIQRIQGHHLSNPLSLFCPSLLGRDILNSCIFNCDPANNEATLVFQ